MASANEPLWVGKDGRMDLATFERLLTPQGQALLAEAAARVAAEGELAVGTRLRETHDGALVAAALTQGRLRVVARGRFGRGAAAMYFTSDALQQAARAGVGRARAMRLATRALSSVLDLGC